MARSEPFSVKVIPSFESDVESPSSSEIVSSAVLLHGEKTDVVLGEDILLKLSAVNLITKPPMTVQVILYPPSGMSVTGSEFVESGAGIYTTTYTLNLPIKVRKEPGQPATSPTDDVGTTAKTPGFEGISAGIVLLLVLFLKRYSLINSTKMLIYYISEYKTLSLR